jgi:predicted RNA binding protein YcfA (HicA-like mRNA interferase family)
MRPISGKDFCRLLEQHGWSLLRIHGSHHIYGKSGSNMRLTIPVHGNKDLKPGLRHNLMKQAGITDHDKNH